MYVYIYLHIYIHIYGYLYLYATHVTYKRQGGFSSCTSTHSWPAVIYDITPTNTKHTHTHVNLMNIYMKYVYMCNRQTGCSSGTSTHPWPTLTTLPH